MQVNSGEPRDESSSNTQPSQSVNASRFRPWRFGLRTLLLLMILLSMAMVWGWNYYLDQLPLMWVPYSENAYLENLCIGRTVLVFVHADWDLSSKAARKELEQPNVKRHLRDHGIVLLEADFTNGPFPVKGVPTASNHLPTTPTIAIVSLVRNKRTVLPYLPTSEQILESLRTFERQP